jgi:hypothetical protein
VRARLLALGLLAAATAVHVLVTLPLQRQAASDGAEYRRARDARRRVHARLARLERAEMLRRQAAAVFKAAAAGETVRIARRSLIGSLGGVPVSNVRISARPGTGQHVATAVTLDADGAFDDVIRLSGHVARPGSGLVLQAVSFVARERSVRLSLEAVGPAEGP